MGHSGQARCLRKFFKKTDHTAAYAAFVGDDVIDLPAIRKCGLA